ncbi:hypothetical protein BJF79_09610 [Actinomadura sp. CNU-125]|uniref:ABC transporter ATP-binding protein n=1 Tax=Actinomadura sp. CNU-125 TaxID=1904961 RepID=UPI0009660606|nr:ABC transporter ATP-binding protein [Actinomadura sp. CNU-125]OLT30493.1 hypothetical protein BJF79_09610 [Actinomadura sp. CNU-125]
MRKSPYHAALKAESIASSASWSAVRALLAERRQLLSLLPAAGRWRAGCLIATLAAAAAAPPATALATGELVHAVSAAADTGAVAGPLLLVVATLLGQQLAEALSAHCSILVARDIDGAVRRRVRHLAFLPRGVAHLGAQGFRADATRSSDAAFTWRVRSAGTAVAGQLLLLSRVCAAVASTLVLAAWFPALALCLLVASLLVRAIIRRHLLYLAHVGDSGALQQRQAEYWAALARGKEGAKEVRLFGLVEWVLRRRLSLHRGWVDQNASARRFVTRSQGLTVVLVTGSALGALLIPGMAAGFGNLDPSGVATCLTAAWGIFQIGSMGFEAFDIEYGAGAARALHRLEAEYGTGSTGAPPEAVRPVGYSRARAPGHRSSGSRM